MNIEERIKLFGCCWSGEKKAIEQHCKRREEEGNKITRQEKKKKKPIDILVFLKGVYETTLLYLDVVSLCIYMHNSLSKGGLCGSVRPSLGNVALGEKT